MNRRAVLTASVAALGVAAGCSDAVVPDEIDQQAQPAAIKQAVLADTGFEHDRTEEVTFEDTVSIQDNEINYAITNWVSIYRRLLDSEAKPMPSQLAILSTPNITVLSQQVNIVGRIDEQVLIERIGNEQGPLKQLGSNVGLDSGDLEKVDETSVMVLDASTTLRVYKTTAELNGEEYDARAAVSRVSHEDDWLVVGGSYPAAESQSPIESLAAGITHPVDPP